MRSDTCQCGQTLFFDNTRCIRCESSVGWCYSCRRIVTLIPTLDGGFQCHHDECQAKLAKCYNDTTNQICNWTVPAGSEQTYCDSCQLTDVIPNLSEAEHHSQWFRLEAAKRRLLYALDLLGLPYRRSDPEANPPLRFQFLEASPTGKPVTTGHENGCITLNLDEADDVEREKARVEFQEPQRTLIGHFRHEIGHYYWDVLVAGQREESFRETFGDERSPTYAEAQKRHYENGPFPDWKQNYISAYATMHPWEDFAESFAGYLDMFSLLDTARQQGLMDGLPHTFAERITAYQRLAVIMNEMTRERGLLDLVPEVITKQVGEKLSWIHRLVEDHQTAPA